MCSVGRWRPEEVQGLSATNYQHPGCNTDRDTHVFGKKFQSLLDLINSSLSIHTLGSFQIKAFKHLSHTRSDSVHNSTKIVPLTSHLALQVVTRPVEKRTRLYGVISAEDNSLSEVLGSGNRYQSDECTRLNFGRTVIRDTRVWLAKSHSHEGFWGFGWYC